MKGIVLVADDDVAVLETYQMILVGGELGQHLNFIDSVMGMDEPETEEENKEFELIAVDSGNRAIVAHQEILQTGRQVAVALLDMRMPPGISGLETAVHLREQDPNIYIIIITAYSDHSVDEIQEALKHDFILLNKPVDPEEFLQVTRNAVISYERFQRVGHPFNYPTTADETEFLRPGKVLVVDNDPLIQKMCESLLQMHCQYEVTLASSGEEALALLKQESYTPDLILLDVMMSGRDGYETCEEIKNDPQYVQTPVVFLTARGDEDDIIRGFSVGGADYITKPFSQEIFLARVVTHMNQYRQYLKDESRYKNSMLKVMSSINEGVIATNHLGEVVLVNDVVERMTHLRSDQLVGESLSSLFVEPLNRDKLSFSEETLQRLQQRLQHILNEHVGYCDQLIQEAPLGMVEIDPVSRLITNANYRMQQLLHVDESHLLGLHVDSVILNASDVLSEPSCGGVHTTLLQSDSQMWKETEVKLGYFWLEREEGVRTMLMVRQQFADLDLALIRLTAFGQLFESEKEAEALHEWELKSGELGESMPVLLQGGVYRDIDHKIEGGIVTLVDLSERKKVESHQQYEAFQAGVCEMSATIFHNIGNAIQGITSGAAQLDKKMGQYLELIDAIEQFNSQDITLKERNQRQQQLLLKLPETMKVLIQGENKYSNLTPIEMIKHSAEHVTEIIQMHRRGFSMDQNSVKTVLTQLLHDALLLVGSKISKCGIGLTQRVELNSQIDSFMLPKNQLLQALINLLKNATEAVIEQHSTGGGEINVSVLATKPTADTEGRVLIEVSDNGVGIGEEELDKVLNFGYSTKKRGSGFGLHATANFVRSLGGELEVESDGVGQGATVRLLMPAVTA